MLPPLPGALTSAMAEAMSGATENKPLRVVVSIPALGLIAKEVGGDRVEVDSLISGASSPHDYALRPSDMANIISADLLIWVGPELEGFLRSPLERRKGKTLQLHKGEPEQGHHGGHHHGEDLHLWLDPDQVIEIAGKLSAYLGRLDPGGLRQYRKNAEGLTKSVADQLRKRQKKLGALPSSFTWLVNHDAFSGFQRHLGLPEPLVFADSDEKKPGLKRTVRLRERLLNSPAPVCVVYEDGYDPRQLATLLRGVNHRQSALDLAGSRQGYGGLYSNYFANLVDNFLDCVAK